MSHLNHPLLNIAEKAAIEAGRIILRGLDRLDRLTIDKKSKNDFVTDIDRQSEAFIIQTIQENYPDHTILGEEFGEIKGQNETVWIIDPLDGTSNFIHGVPHFAVSIGIQIQGRLEAGVIYDPIRNEIFKAVKGRGAQLNQRKIRVSAVEALSEALLGTGFPYKQMEHLDRFMGMMKELTPISSGIRRAGSAALDLAYVAAGRYDGFWEYGLSPWDLAAGILLIREAGGRLSDFQGGEDYYQKGQIVAGNPKVFKELVKVVQRLAR